MDYGHQRYARWDEYARSEYHQCFHSTVEGPLRPCVPIVPVDLQYVGYVSEL